MTTTVNTTDLRKEPGRFLDRVFYRNERFIVKSGNEPRAVIVPLADYEAMERLKVQARERFFALTDEVRKRVEQAGMTDEELQAQIDEAIAEVRAENKPTSTPKS